MHSLTIAYLGISIVSLYGSTVTVVLYAMQLYLIWFGYGCALKRVDLLHEILAFGEKPNDKSSFLVKLGAWCHRTLLVIFSYDIVLCFLRYCIVLSARKYLVGDNEQSVIVANVCVWDSK